MKNASYLAFNLFWIGVITASLALTLQLASAFYSRDRSDRLLQYRELLDSVAAPLTRHGEWLLLKNQEEYIALMLLDSSLDKRIAYLWLAAPSIEHLVETVEEEGLVDIYDKLPNERLRDISRLKTESFLDCGIGESMMVNERNTISVKYVGIPCSRYNDSKSWLNIPQSDQPFDLYLDQGEDLRGFHPPDPRRWIRADMYR